MKKLLVFVFMMFVSVAGATTVNLNWTVDNTNYAQTTCETGNNLTLPSPPTKYGYTFRGWNWTDTEIMGTGTQNGTPTPENPIAPVFYENNGMILRAIENVADSYSTSTGKITRRIGVKVFTGTEVWYNNKTEGNYTLFLNEGLSRYPDDVTSFICTHLPYLWRWNTVQNESVMSNVNVGSSRHALNVWVSNQRATTAEEFRAFLAEQYANGTPVTVYYPLAEPFEETWNGQNNQFVYPFIMNYRICRSNLPPTSPIFWFIHIFQR